jgi:hypothetical protein
MWNIYSSRILSWDVDVCFVGVENPNIYVLGVFPLVSGIAEQAQETGGIFSRREEKRSNQTIVPCSIRIVSIERVYVFTISHFTQSLMHGHNNMARNSICRK